MGRGRGGVEGGEEEEEGVGKGRGGGEGSGKEGERARRGRRKEGEKRERETGKKCREGKRAGPRKKVERKEEREGEGESESKRRGCSLRGKGSWSVMSLVLRISGLNSSLVDPQNHSLACSIPEDRMYIRNAVMGGLGNPFLNH